MPSKHFGRAIRLMAEQHNTTKTFSGNGCLKHRDAIVKFSQEIGARNALDFGCGKGHQYVPDKNRDGVNLADMLGYQPHRYDPGVGGFNELPPEGTTFDLVLCVDVLECVPEQDMDFVIGQLAHYADKGLFVTVATYPSKKELPDGSNAHLTVRDREWWHYKFSLLCEVRPELKLKLLVA